MSVKIAALEAENVKRIKAVALTPSPTGLTIVGGNNNQGKTSVLDALAWALGGEKFRPTAAVRDGALAPPHLKVILSNGVVVEQGQKQQPDRDGPHRPAQRPAAAERFCGAAGAGPAPLYAGQR